MRLCNLPEATTQLAELVAAALAGDEVVIARDHVPLVRLEPIARAVQRRQVGFAAAWVSVSDDFDAPLASFGEEP
jgi:antitoxin (DNA-binding transcriptional repressor) of toxin-antitoxin stability system